jgi:choice-of-anchor A domain-containing protein
MSSIRTAAENASTSAAALTKTSGMTDQSGSISLSNSSVTINALQNASENVLDITNLSLSNSTLTLNDNGYSGAKFIINVTGTFSVTGNSSIKITGGGTGADIIFNIEGTGSTVSLTGSSSSSIVGTILAPQRNVNLSGGGTLTGAVLAGLGGTGYTVQTQTGGYNITSLGYVPRVSTPEPSSIALFGAGVSALLAARRRRRPRT